MNDKTKKERNIASRKDLIKFFEKGSLPTEEHFVKLINSNFNKADDRLDISEDDGIMIYPTRDGKLMNFFQESNDENPKYEFLILPKGVFIQQTEKELKPGVTKEDIPEFFIDSKSGNIGIGNSTPQQKLEVSGLIASEGRLGTYKEGKLPADGNWYNIFDENKYGVNAYEVMAYARGKELNGKYSLLHAVVISTYGKSKISKTVTYYKNASTRLNIRLVSKLSKIKEGSTPFKKQKFLKRLYSYLFETKDKDRAYNLQLRTMRNYKAGLNAGEDSPDINIYYKITQLWNHDLIPRQESISNRSSQMQTDQN